MAEQVTMHATISIQLNTPGLPEYMQREITPVNCRERLMEWIYEILDRNEVTSVEVYEFPVITNNWK